MRGTNVIEMYPIPTGLKISQADWDASPTELKSEIERMWCELSAGIAIQKDRRCGRLKSHQRPSEVSFHALHLLDMDVWRYPTNEVKIAKADALRAALAPDVERMAQMDGLEPFHDMAKATGKRLSDVLRNFINMENLLREDFTAGIFKICENIGIDPLAFLTMAARGDFEGERLTQEQIASSSWRGDAA